MTISGTVANPAGEAYRLDFTKDDLSDGFPSQWPCFRSSATTHWVLSAIRTPPVDVGPPRANRDYADGYRVARSTALNRTTTYGLGPIQVNTGASSSPLMAPGP